MEFNNICSNRIRCNLFLEFMIYLIPLSFFIIVAIDAYTDTYRQVKHKRGLFLYALACVFVSIFFLKFTDVNVLWLIGFSLLTRLAAFDPIYNLLRGKPFIYEGMNEGKKDKSIIDQIEAWTGLSIFWLRIIYIIIYVGFLIFYFYAG